MNIYKKIILSIFVVAAFTSGNALAAMTPVSFSCITTTTSLASDCATGDAQFSMEVLSVATAPDKVLFKFFNVGSSASSINGVYFDDGTLLGISKVFNTNSQVSFSAGSATPMELPGNTLINPNFITTTGFLADANLVDPTMPLGTLGVNPGETLGIEFSLKTIGTAQQNYDSVITDLQTGRLRIGLSAIDFSSGGVASFVSNPVPLPPALLLFGSGLLLLFGRKRLKA